MGKYQLDTKGKTAVSKFHEKRTPDKLDKNKKLEDLRMNFLNKKKLKEDK